MNILFLALNLISIFNLKWTLPQGTLSTAGQILIRDTDRDGYMELIFTMYSEFAIYFYEFHPPNTWIADTIPYAWAPILWDCGDFDNDGLYDLVMQSGCVDPYWVGITIFEAPDSFHYPNQEVWRDTLEPAIILPLCAYDMDHDSLLDIVMDQPEPYGEIGVFEAIGNNRYDLVYADNPDTTNTQAPGSTIAFGDFDQDCAMEFVPAGGNDGYWVYECIGNNSYHKVYEGLLPTFNIRDCFTVSDADQDGKLEFAIKGFSFSLINAFIFEATSDNTYGIIKSFSFPSGDYYGGYSDAGDVDGDSIPEIVLEARQRVYIIKARGNDSFYVWDSLPGNTSGSSIRVTHDLDGNGLNEIVISGNDQTRIYEYNTGAINEKNFTFSPNLLYINIYPNPFKQTLNINIKAKEEKICSVKIYDISGRLIKSIYEGLINGNTVLKWNSKDASCPNSNGIYFIQINIDGIKYTNKILMIK